MTLKVHMEDGQGLLCGINVKELGGRYYRSTYDPLRRVTRAWDLPVKTTSDRFKVTCKSCWKVLERTG